MTNYDRVVSRCCRLALLRKQSSGFAASIIDDIKRELPDLTLTRNQISYHVNVGLGCAYNGKEFTAKKWIVADKDNNDISELLRMLRNEY